MYRVQQSRDTFSLFKVYFDAMAEERRPFDEMPTVKPAPVTQNHLLPSVLPSGALHIGWPSRVDTAERMVERFRKVNAMEAYTHRKTFQANEVTRFEAEGWKNGGIPANIRNAKSKSRFKSPTVKRKRTGDLDSQSVVSQQSTRSKGSVSKYGPESSRQSERSSSVMGSDKKSKEPSTFNAGVQMYNQKN